MLGQEKQKLVIGGIFPLSGEKFNAPELIPGEPYSPFYVPCLFNVYSMEFAKY